MRFLKLKQHYWIKFPIVLDNGHTEQLFRPQIDDVEKILIRIEHDRFSLKFLI